MRRGALGEVLRDGKQRPETGDGGGGRLLVAGGTVWAQGGPRACDVLIEGERIAAVGEVAARPQDEVIDATGLHVLPGMIDFHVHIDDRIGACSLADDFPSASRLAVANGITTLLGFVTQGRGESLTAAVERAIARGRGRSWCDFAFHLTPTVQPWHEREVAALIERGFRTFKLYTTYRDAGLLTGWDELAGVMRWLAARGARLLVHCEDDEVLSRIDATRLDPAAPFSHTLMRPPEAEVAAVRRVLELARQTGCAVHIVHVSTFQGAALVGAARGSCEVTCETAPQYLLLDDSLLAGAGGHRYLCTPPLRTAANRERMERAAVAGGFDIFATDHCAFSRADKDAHAADLRRVPNGIAGLGALVPLIHELLVVRGGRDLEDLVLRLAATPARLAGFYPRKGVIAPGADADLAILDPHGPPRPVVSSLADTHEPYPGRSTTLDFRHVLVRGQVVAAANAALDARPPRGTPLAGA